MDIAQVAAFMKAHSAYDSYHFQEEIELRKILGRTRDDCLEGFFLSLFNALQGDVQARARLVDIALRYDNHTLLACAAASKIGALTDEDKILLIPAHLFSSTPEVALAIAKQIGSIRADDPRRYFLERGLGHPDPSVRRVCAESLAYRQNTQVHEYAHASATFCQAAESERTLGRQVTETQVTESQATGKRSRDGALLRAKKSRTKKFKSTPVKLEPTERTKRIEMRLAPKVPAETVSRIRATSVIAATAGEPIKNASSTNKSINSAPTNGAATMHKPSEKTVIFLAPAAGETRDSTRGAVRHIGGNLLELIAAHIGDPHPEVRLKWVKRIGEIPARDDGDDVRKMEFITIALADSSREVSLASVAQIEFLLLDTSKLAMLLKILSLSPDLIQAAQFRKVLDSLPSALWEEYMELAKKIVSDSVRSKRVNLGALISNDTVLRKKGEGSDTDVSERQKVIGSPDVGKPATSMVRGGKATNSRDNVSAQVGILGVGAVDKSAEARKSNDESLRGLTVSDADRAETQVILSELNFDEWAIADLTNEKNPMGSFFNGIAPDSEAQNIDNYFLRHTAVLHVKDIHAEDIRYRLYLSVLDHDPKDIVRQIAVQEARNLESGHAQEILRRALADSAWQVRVSALENLLHFILDADEKRRILTTCSRDAEYHVRQKAAALLALLTDVERGKIHLL